MVAVDREPVIRLVGHRVNHRPDLWAKVVALIIVALIIASTMATIVHMVLKRPSNCTPEYSYKTCMYVNFRGDCTKVAHCATPCPPYWQLIRDGIVNTISYCVELTRLLIVVCLRFCHALHYTVLYAWYHDSVYCSELRELLIRRVDELRLSLDELIFGPIVKPPYPSRPLSNPVVCTEYVTYLVASADCLLKEGGCKDEGF